MFLIENKKQKINKPPYEQYYELLLSNIALSEDIDSQVFGPDKRHV